MNETVHVLPLNNLKEHVERLYCKCQPRIDPVITKDGLEVGWIVVHNAYDGREFYEDEKQEGH